MFTYFRPHISLGFFPASPEYPPLVLSFYKDVTYDKLFPSAKIFVFLQSFAHSNGSSAQIKFDYTLRGYVTSDFEKENLVITGPVSSPVLFEEDVTQLEDETFWRITYNKGDNTYKIVREDPPPGQY